MFIDFNAIRVFDGMCRAANTTPLDPWPITWPSSISVGINVNETPVDVFVMPSFPISKPSLWNLRASDELNYYYTSTDNESSSIVLSETLSNISFLPLFI